MDIEEEKYSQLLKFDMNIEKRKEDNSEIFKNDFDDDFLKNNKINKRKKIRMFILLLIIIIIIGLIIFFIINSNNKRKISCIIGEKEKCKTCKEDSNECLTCNLGYILYKGKCFLDYSFRATYYTDKDNQTIKLIGNPDIYKIIKMKIGEERLINPSSNYTFASAGNHTVDILMDISQITSFANFFNGVTNLIFISFYPSFHNDNITDMNGFLSNCISLVLY